jgi:hypothetical protein
MLLPNVENVYIDDRKLIDYSLSETHPVGKHKARVFKSALDFSVENFQDLKESILEEILKKEAIITGTNLYGTLYVVDVYIENPPKQAFVRTSWIVKTNEDFPRLTSCYVIT